jgi:flavin reductase (DIM6/NTAB) family NADH-FMN oxidoreductase RutF/DNA-binding GntR family transcriptional regulator
MGEPNDLQGIDPQTFRDVVGYLASGVTVITTRSAEGDHGMTVSSVTSLSLTPPMMLACLNNAAPTAAAVARTGRYAVNILGQGHGRIARQFAAPSEDKFADVKLEEGLLGGPLLADALAHLECRVIEQVTGGTHSVFIGLVERATARPGDPLTYFRGGFGRFEFDRDDAVYQAARKQILDRMYGPDTALNLEDFAFALGVDETAMFYALTRLTSDGLVRRDSRRGYVIVAFDASISDEAFDARKAIELGVVELTIGRVRRAELSELRARFEAMAALLVGDRFVDFEGYLDANYAFHEKVVALAGNSQLLDAFRRLSIRDVMARAFGATPVTSQRYIEVQRALTEAFENADAAAARRAVNDYARLAKERAREILAQMGGRL